MSETVATLPLADIKNFEQTIKNIPEQIREQALLDMGEALVGEAQVDAPVRKGDLKESHYVSDFENDAVVIGTNTDYAMAVHQRHPTKSLWFINAITRNFRRISEAAIKKALKERGAQ